jgi:hypothetical protein
MSSRILRQNLKTQKWEIFNTPFVQGKSSQGMYSVDFYGDKFGIAVGGDYTAQKENQNNIATTTMVEKPGKCKLPAKTEAI